MGAEILTSNTPLYIKAEFFKIFLISVYQKAFKS
jgi:hypothetical protein